MGGSGRNISEGTQGEREEARHEIKVKEGDGQEEQTQTMAWRLGGLEAWRLGGLEAWRLGGLEAWRLGGLEAWRLGGLEAWTC